MNGLQDLLLFIQSRNFFGHISAGPPEQIIGGDSFSQATGLPLYGHPFSILNNEAGGWLVRTNREGQLIREKIASTPEDVLSLILGNK